jgi:hypothetical protein
MSGKQQTTTEKQKSNVADEIPFGIFLLMFNRQLQINGFGEGSAGISY